MFEHKVKKDNRFLLDIVCVLFIVCMINMDSFGATVIGPGANIQKTTQATTEPETTHPKGFKVDNAQYYDYVGVDDQGRPVDKYNIIIGKGQGGSGQGGGSSGSGSKGSDSSGTGGSGTSGYTAGQAPGQGGTSANVGGNGNSNSRNIIGANGSQSSNNIQKVQQASEEAARQAQASNIEYNEALKESILAKARAQTKQTANGQVVKEKTIVETETVTYKADEVTRAPVNQTEKALKESQITQRVTQPKPVFDNTVPTVVVPETVEEATVNTPDMNLPEVPINVPVVTNGPEDMIEETTIIQSEVVTKEEVTTRDTVKPTKAQTEEAKKQDAAKDDKKKGDQGEKDHDDKDAEYKKELGDNKEDGKGDGKGGAYSGVKIFEIERKGNIGITATAGINNIERLIAGIVISVLLLLGVLYYYVPYIFKPKNKKSNYIS